MTTSSPPINTVPAGSTPVDDTAVDAVLADISDDAAPEDGTDR